LFVTMFYLVVIWFNPFDTLYLYDKKKSLDYSLFKTILYLTLAIIFLVPANLLPIMPIYKFSVFYPNTLLDGVISFYNEGSVSISIIIFLSSILLPIVKIIGIISIIILSRLNTTYKTNIITTKFYIFVKSISKFSMIDVFVVVLASSFIQSNDLIRIEIGEAFIPFICVVFFTTLAYKNFDIRTIWR